MDNTSKQVDVRETAPSFWRLWGRRILIHISGLLFMGCMSEGMANPKIADDFSVGVYLGFICLLHRGVWHEKRWYVSSLLGLSQGILLLFLGMPLYAAIFWGGVQSWVQRVIRKWDEMGGEWIVLPFLIMASSEYVSDTQRCLFPLWPLYTFIIITIIGYGTNLVYLRIRRETIHKTLLTSTLRRLQNCSENTKLTADLQKQVNIILAQAMTIEQAALHTDDRGRALIANLDAACRSLEKQTYDNGPSIVRGGWSSELFKSKAWNKLAGKQDVGPLVATFKQCNQELMAILRSGKSHPSGTTSVDSLNIFEHQARQLVLKSEQAPEKLAKEAESIALLTFEIIKSMRDDPRDRPAGERFLQRYLPATEHIVDEYARLISSNSDREDVALAVRRAEEVLAHLHKAFAEELSAMLANDSASFTAELNALDKLLKMSGH